MTVAHSTFTLQICLIWTDGNLKCRVQKLLMTSRVHSKSRSIKVNVTPGCYNAIKRFSEMRGMNMSQMMYLAFRYNFHREALEDPAVRKLFLEEGVPFDPQVVDDWRQNIAEQKTLKEIFTPMPAEALEGPSPSMIKLTGRFLMQAPKSPLEAVWRVTATALVAGCLLVGYGLVARPAIFRAMVGLESQEESVEHRLLDILERQSLDKRA